MSKVMKCIWSCVENDYHVICSLFFHVRCLCLLSIHTHATTPTGHTHTHTAHIVPTPHTHRAHATHTHCAHATHTTHRTHNKDRRAHVVEPQEERRLDHGRSWPVHWAGRCSLTQFVSKRQRVLVCFGSISLRKRTQRRCQHRLTAHDSRCIGLVMLSSLSTLP